jgi:hypothetical protein
LVERTRCFLLQGTGRDALKDLLHGSAARYLCYHCQFEKRVDLAHLENDSCGGNDLPHSDSQYAVAIELTLKRQKLRFKSRGAMLECGFN